MPSDRRYVLGAGIAGLIWAFYNPEYRIVTDKVGWGVAGSTPSVALYDSPEARSFIARLMDFEPDSSPLAIGYILDDGEIHTEDHLSPRDILILSIKKMVAWRDIAEHGFEHHAPAVVSIERFGQRTLPVLNVRASEVMGALEEFVGSQVTTGERVMNVGQESFSTLVRDRPFDDVVSTIPAPIFASLWRGSALGWSLRSIPLTLVVSNKKPSQMNGWHFLYDARRSSCVSRVSVQGDILQYEITGAWRDDLELLEPRDVFPFPYGRILGGGPVTSPSGRIRFLGRFAEWDYRVLTDNVLERSIREAEGS